MHIASAANTPIIAMFSVTHAKVGAPNSDNFITIQAPLSCEIPCGLKHCYKEINCTDSISVNTVLKAAEKLLNRKEAIKEDWKGDLPAQILFKDWEWHTINQEREEDTTLLRALQTEKKQTINVTIHPHLNLPHQGGRIQGDNEYSPPLVGGVRGGGKLLLKTRDDARVFRLPIDRSFTISGYGCVVTGPIMGGQISVEDEVEIFPVKQIVRIRGIEVTGERVDTAFAGQRAAINLSGIKSAEIKRGYELSIPGYLQ